MPTLRAMEPILRAMEPILRAMEQILRVIEVILRVHVDILKNVQKISKKNKVLRMGWPGGQNVPTPCESLFMLSRGPQLPYTKKYYF